MKVWEKEQLRRVAREKENGIRPYNHMLVVAETLTPQTFLEFLMINWGEWLTQTEQLIDPGLRKKEQKR